MFVFSLWLAVVLYCNINVSHSIWSFVVRWKSSHNSVAFNVCVETHTVFS